MYTGIIIRTLHRTRSGLFLGARLTKLRSTLTNGSRLREWWRAREKRPNAGKIALAQCKFAPYLSRDAINTSGFASSKSCGLLRRSQSFPSYISYGFESGNVPFYTVSLSLMYTEDCCPRKIGPNVVNLAYYT